MAEGGALLRRYTGLNPYREFESLSLRQMLRWESSLFEGSGFQATYNVTAKKPADVKAGNSYFGFDCAACKARFAVWEDSSTGAKPFTSKRPCTFRVSCPQCGADRRYRLDQVQQFKA